MNKAGKILLIGGGAAVIAAVAVSAANLANTVNKLDVLLIKSEVDKGLRLKDVVMNPLGFRIKMRFTLLFKNPTKTALSFSNPYVKAIYVDPKGEATTVGSSTDPANFLVTIPAFDKHELTAELEMASSDLLAVMPDIASYMASKLMGASDPSKARTLTLEMTTTVPGVGTITEPFPFTL